MLRRLLKGRRKQDGPSWDPSPVLNDAPLHGTGKQAKVEPAQDVETEGAENQQDQWNLVLREKTSLIQSSRGALQPISGQASFDSSVELLRAVYMTHGVTQKLPVIINVMKTIEPFTQALTTLSQTSSVASLVWGSVQMVFQVRVQSSCGMSLCEMKLKALR